MSKKTLVIVAHPHIEQSRVNRALKEFISNKENITIHEIYKKYPDGKIDVATEQKLLLDHDNIVLQFPLYWYHMPPLLKQWLDDTFTYGFSHGVNGNKLKDKKLQVAISTAMSQKHYMPILWNDEDKIHLAQNTTGGSEGLNPQDQPYMKPALAQRYGVFIIDAIMIPMEQTAYHTQMQWQAPFITHSAIPLDRSFHALTEEGLQKECENYLKLINALNL